MLRGRRYLTPREFSEQSGVALRTVQEWCAAGKLRTKPSRKPGSRLQIVASELARIKRESERG